MPSVHYAEIAVDCDLEHAWAALLNYAAWNPSFVGAEVTSVRGERGTEGEVVRIRKRLLDVRGAPLPEFFAETVKLVPWRHIVWYVTEPADSFRNFVDFGLDAQGSHGVKFSVYYYAQYRLAGELLARQRQERDATLPKLASAFKHYCESASRDRS